jgi:hypothetical protein
MALDIDAGDVLVVSSTEYPIRAVEHYESHGFGTSSAFSLLASVSCSTKRSPATSGGKRGAPAEHLTGLSCTPLDPVDAETETHMEVKTPYTTRQTFISDGTDYARLIVNERRA